MVKYVIYYLLPYFAAFPVIVVCSNKLLWERIYLTGTLRKNRPMPQMIKNARPHAGDAVYARQGQNMLCCFRDDTVKYVIYYLLPYFAAFPVIVVCYDHLGAKIDPNHECIVCAYDPRFTVQCISRL
jgi:hypothetical protein